MPRFPQVMRNLPRTGRGALPESLLGRSRRVDAELDGTAASSSAVLGAEPIVRVLAEAETAEAAEGPVCYSRRPGDTRARLIRSRDAAIGLRPALRVFRVRFRAQREEERTCAESSDTSDRATPKPLLLERIAPARVPRLRLCRDRAARGRRSSTTCARSARSGTLVAAAGGNGSHSHHGLGHTRWATSRRRDGAERPSAHRLASPTPRHRPERDHRDYPSSCASS